MKKVLCFMLALVSVFVLIGCDDGGNNEDKVTTAAVADTGEPGPMNADGVDVDLTALSSTMVYSEVYNMMYYPQQYIGKKVKMKGQFSIYQAVDEAGNAIPDQIYYACVIADATACCQQGLEFVLADERSYPDEYPELGTEITVTGEFRTYMEGDSQYCHLVLAQMDV